MHIGWFANGSFNVQLSLLDVNYKLRPLSEVSAFIAQYKHLPDMPSETEVLANGIDVTNMQAMQQQKIEELTLYVIELQKEMDAVKKEMELLKK